MKHLVLLAALASASCGVSAADCEECARRVDRLTDEVERVGDKISRVERNQKKILDMMEETYERLSQSEKRRFRGAVGGYGTSPSDW